MTRRYALSDAHLQRIKDLLPCQAVQPGATARDNRLFVDAVLYRYRAGIAWRDLPERFGDFRVVHTRHSDKGFDAKARLVQPLLDKGKQVVIPSRSTSKQTRQ